MLNIYFPDFISNNLVVLSTLESTYVVNSFKEVEHPLLVAGHQVSCIDELLSFALRQDRQFVNIVAESIVNKSLSSKRRRLRYQSVTIIFPPVLTLAYCCSLKP